jgi:hypothetical protein
MVKGKIPVGETVVQLLQTTSKITKAKSQKRGKNCQANTIRQGKSKEMDGTVIVGIM